MICYATEPNVIFFPCKHMVIDQKCYSQVLDNKAEEAQNRTRFQAKKQTENTCVVCRKKIDYAVFLDPEDLDNNNNSNNNIDHQQSK